VIALLLTLGAPTPACGQQLRAGVIGASTGSHRLQGAVVGFVVGGVVTYVVLHSGGSTAPCNQSENQDAMSSSECLGLTLLGAAAGAGLGAIVGGFFKSEQVRIGLQRDRVQLSMVVGWRP
jgi:hypothetical protein